MQRLSIAYMMQTDAKVVLLDEPTAGLDPGARRLFCEIARRNAEQRITILCTHILDDLETLADRILALRDGRIAQDAQRAELRSVYAEIFELEPAS